MCRRRGCALGRASWGQLEAGPGARLRSWILHRRIAVEKPPRMWGNGSGGWVEWVWNGEGQCSGCGVEVGVPEPGGQDWWLLTAVQRSVYPVTQ